MSEPFGGVRMTDKVYVVTSGEYSDYRIEAVYANQADAEKHMELLANRSAEVEEWPLGLAAPTPRGRWFVTWGDGLEWHARPLGVVLDPNAATTFYYGPYRGVHELRVVADSREKALKIAWDWWAKHKAEEEGL